MTSRPYRLGRRQITSDQTRDRIISASRELLSSAGFSEFTIDAVAEQAGVARMTVYYQFRSKLGLLEALFNSLASHRLSSQLVEAIQRPDPVAGLEDFIRAIGGFWNSDRIIITRLQGLAALDPDFGAVWREREGLRRKGLSALASRVSQQLSRPSPKQLGAVVDALFALVSFETFNAMAGDRRTFMQVAPIVVGMALATFDLPTRQGAPAVGSTPRARRRPHS